MLRPIILAVILSMSLCAYGTDKTILVLGDSLSAAYGIDAQSGWVSLLRERLDRAGYRYRVINASISGDTTHGANTRLDAILKEITPDITIVELGGNDGLRGIPPAEIEANLTAIIEKTATAGSRILLAEMLLPPNYGTAYMEKFVALYRDLGARDDVILSNFILADIADNPDLMQSDGIHPKAEAQAMMLENLWPDLYPLLD
ncbi:MAG: arylesterase [Gammaproteobacteria bacterium]|nr:arylesterase [Gammaproteobacteria bacterium]